MLEIECQDGRGRWRAAGVDMIEDEDAGGVSVVGEVVGLLREGYLRTCARRRCRAPRWCSLSLPMHACWVSRVSAGAVDAKRTCYETQSSVLQAVSCLNGNTRKVGKRKAPDSESELQPFPCEFATLPPLSIALPFARACRPRWDLSAVANVTHVCCPSRLLAAVVPGISSYIPAALVQPHDILSTFQVGNGNVFPLHKSIFSLQFSSLLVIWSKEAAFAST